jgi:hypothetical protein
MRAVFIKAGEQPNTPDTNHPQQRRISACPILYRIGALNHSWSNVVGAGPGEVFALSCA